MRFVGMASSRDCPAFAMVAILAHTLGVIVVIYMLTGSYNSFTFLLFLYGSFSLFLYLVVLIFSRLLIICFKYCQIYLRLRHVLLILVGQIQHPIVVVEELCLIVRLYFRLITKFNHRVSLLIFFKNLEHG